MPRAGTHQVEVEEVDHLDRALFEGSAPLRGGPTIGTTDLCKVGDLFTAAVFGDPEVLGGEPGDGCTGLRVDDPNRDFDDVDRHLALELGLLGVRDLAAGCEKGGSGYQQRGNCGCPHVCSLSSTGTTGPATVQHSELEQLFPAASHG
jgi:hypothetical protein